VAKYYKIAFFILLIAPKLFATDHKKHDPDIKNENSKAKKAEKKGPKDGISVGVATVISESVYRGVGNKFAVLPVFTIKYGNFYLRGSRASYKIFGNKQISFGATLALDLFSGGYESDDSDSLRGMDERKGTLYGGAFSRLKLGLFSIQAVVKKDLIGVHTGVVSGLGGSLMIPIMHFLKSQPVKMIGLNYQLNHYDESYINYYYGVKETEATPSRPLYKRKGTLTSSTSLFIRAKFSDQVSGMLLIKREFLSRIIRDSPIVSEKRLDRAFLSVMYRF
jgi:MipA family protein